jgi:protein-S-isoprenylcysteine O-methyltransferase Ste14
MFMHRIAWSLGTVGVFIAYHLLYRLDGGLSSSPSDREMSFRSFRPVYLIVKYSTAAVCFYSYWCAGSSTSLKPSTLLVRYAGIMLAVAGSGAAAFSKLSLGPSYSPCYASVVPPRLVASGPYRWVRHPLYASNLLAMMGLVLSSNSTIALLNFVVVFIYYVAASEKEERTLLAALPGYQAYRRRTGRFMPIISLRRRVRGQRPCAFAADRSDC